MLAHAVNRRGPDIATFFTGGDPELFNFKFFERPSIVFEYVFPSPRVA
jgi:hypothetical protein